jgi:hypothetical protein
LKGAFQLGTKGTVLRQALIVSQFVITLILLNSIVIIDAQMAYIQHKDLGYGWYLMNRRLENFAYRVAIEWWMFAVSALLPLSLALLTISFQSIKATLTNPQPSEKLEYRITLSKNNGPKMTKF